MAKSKKPKFPKGTTPEVVSSASSKSSVSSDTKDWIENASDELAAKVGMVFDGERGEYVVRWIEKNCYLYEGSFAGKPMKLIEYQRRFIMRAYSWVYYSDDWKEYIRRFNRANLLCAKKNGKSPLLAALGLYMTVADGEQGQKVYTAAMNGSQAIITQGHAIAMCEQSPNLKEPVCVVNKSTSQITHTESRSRMMILRGDDSRGAKSNEGINGSVFIDELHVVDREMHERTKGAGISRKEPMNLAVSTAGDDPSSYGAERVEYGRDVTRGKKQDLHFLHVEYAAPQKVKDADIAVHLEEYAKAANPALGTPLVRMPELKSDYATSVDKPREMARFKQYRLNIQIGSVNPWLNESRWAECACHIPPEFFRDKEARLGLDLSRTRDMTAAIFNIKDGDELNPLIYLWPMFWIPRATAEKRKNLFPYMEWAESGYLNLTEGDVVDYGVVEDDICNFVERNELCVTDEFFDQTYAEEMTQRIANRLGCNRTAVSQTLMTLSPLAKEFERKIDAGLIRHPDNAVLNWQVGHVQVWTDNNQNCRPVKPDPNSGKSIDGILAILDTFAADAGESGDGESGPGISFY